MSRAPKVPKHTLAQLARVKAARYRIHGLTRSAYQRLILARGVLFLLAMVLLWRSA